MATFTNIFIETNELNKVIEYLTEWFREFHKPKEIEKFENQEYKDCFVKFYEDVSDKKKRTPTRIAIRQESDKWIKIDYNSFEKIESLALALSSLLFSQVLVVHKQTNSDYNYLAVYDKAVHLRTIEASENQILKNIGSPFKFEWKRLYEFHEVDLDDYCKELGLLFTDFYEEERSWILLKI